jgi:hypothetical protein
MSLFKTRFAIVIQIAMSDLQAMIRIIALAQQKNRLWRFVL